MLCLACCLGSNSAKADGTGTSGGQASSLTAIEAVFSGLSFGQLCFLFAKLLSAVLFAASVLCLMCVCTRTHSYISLTDFSEEPLFYRGNLSSFPKGNFQTALTLAKVEFRRILFHHDRV